MVTSTEIEAIEHFTTKIATTFYFKNCNNILLQKLQQHFTSKIATTFYNKNCNNILQQKLQQHFTTKIATTFYNKNCNNILQQKLQHHFTTKIATTFYNKNCNNILQQKLQQHFTTKIATTFYNKNCNNFLQQKLQQHFTTKIATTFYNKNCNILQQKLQQHFTTKHNSTPSKPLVKDIYLFRINPRQPGSRSSRSGEELVDKERREMVFATQTHGLLEVLLRLSRIPANDVSGNSDARHPARVGSNLLNIYQSISILFDKSILFDEINYYY